MSEDSPSNIILGGTQTCVEISAWLESLGLPVTRVEDLDALAAVLRNRVPASLVIDLDGGEDATDRLDGLGDVLDRVRPPLVIVLSGRADQDVRLRAVKAGADVFLPKPLEPRLLLQYLSQPRSVRKNDCRILLAADSPDLLADTITGLERHGMAVKRLRHASQLLLSVINFSPDLLLIGDPLDGHAGTTLGRMVHQLSDYEDLPVIYIRPGDKGAGTDAIEAAPVASIRDDAGVGELETLVNRLVKIARSRRNRVHYLRDCDRATGLLNRHGFFDQLQRGVQPHAGSTAMIVLELENLQHGYPVLSPQQVDELLVTVANVLGRLQLPSLLDARIGEHSFAFMVAGKDSAGLCQLGQRLVHAVSSIIHDIGPHSVTIGCNAGIAVSHAPPADGMALLALASSACSEAHRAGSSRVELRVLDTTVADGRPAGEGRLLGQLRDVIENSRFRLFYQPIASLHGNGVGKYAVLLRVQEGNKVVSPSGFVTAAEQNGLMSIVDRWVMERVVTKLCEHGSGISLFVKVSTASIQDPEFLPWLQALFREQGMPGKRLVIEIGDAALRADMRHAAVFAAGIRRLGCHVALQHPDISRDLAPVLKHVPASYVIIMDKTLEAGVIDSSRYDCLQSLVEVAVGQRCRVIATMVETAGSLQLLWKLGVHYIQGNFLQEPGEALDFDFGSEEAV